MNKENRTLIGCGVFSLLVYAFLSVLSSIFGPGIFLHGLLAIGAAITIMAMRGKDATRPEIAFLWLLAGEPKNRQ